ncbi:dipeptidase [Thalassobacillus sp. CUG 92003]|uniref:dipeptidase n=1 Tax=Thalassobacillus sp. CUG 92003 TaxID=2736641 RepID=UPI0015E6CB91|nr:dipeptidase [Thalassobacillus sp. CUG 92003]
MDDFPIIDGHNDVLLKLHETDQPLETAFFEESAEGHIDFPRAARGGLAGGFFAIYSPTPSFKNNPQNHLTEHGYDIPIAAAIDYESANRLSQRMIADMYRLEKQSKGGLRIIKNIDNLTQALHTDTMAAIIHMEGAEAIDSDLDALHVFYQAGLRSLGIVWSRPNAFGEGVPFRFPSSPNTGSGLTDLGKKLVKECNALGIMLDMTHLNEKGFWDTAQITDAPLVATHSNAHALCPMSRNLTDKQLDAIGESDGVVGVTYSLNMLNPDGKPNLDTPMEAIIRHIEYIAERVGIDHVALGSDFDGTTVPRAVGDAAGLPKLIEAMQQRGFNNEALKKITHENWVRVLGATWA